MSEKRRDNRNRILHVGESQRKDMAYQYRYTDVSGKRRTVYANDLQELRKVVYGRRVVKICNHFEGIKVLKAIEITVNKRI